MNKLLIILIILVSGSISAETIVLKSRTAIFGKIISNDKDSIIFEQTNKKREKILKKNILRITYKNLNNYEIEKIIQEAEITDVVQLEVPLIIPVTPAAPVASSKGNPEPIKPTLFGAFWRSAIIPGWGQIYQGRQIAGMSYLFLGIAGIGLLAHENREYNNEIRDYKYSEKQLAASILNSANTELHLIRRMDLTAHYIHVDKASHRFDVAGGILAGLYVLNLFDVVIFRPKENLSIHTNVIRDQIGLSFVYRY